MNPQDEALSVTQADYDAALALVNDLESASYTKVTKLSGNHPAIQAFARHRLSHSTPGDAEVREALERSKEGWENAVEMGIIPPQHRNTATILADDCRAALSRLATPSGRAQGEVGAVKECLTVDELDKSVTLTVVNWEGRLHCAYLNDFRIVGGKPWGGGSTAKEWKTTLREVIRAFPALQKAVGLNYLGQPLPAAPPTQDQKGVEP